MSLFLITALAVSPPISMIAAYTPRAGAEWMQCDNCAVTDSHWIKDCRRKVRNKEAKKTRPAKAVAAAAALSSDDEVNTPLKVQIAFAQRRKCVVPTKVTVLITTDLAQTVADEINIDSDASRHLGNQFAWCYSETAPGRFVGGWQADACEEWV